MGLLRPFTVPSRKVVSSTRQTESWVTPALSDHTVLRDPNMRAQAIEEDSRLLERQDSCEESPARPIGSL
jgi:hypothetical protein